MQASERRHHAEHTEHTERPQPAHKFLNILAIQSWVAYGHVGNAAAVFPLQRLGAEVWPIHTVQFSNHPGYGGYTGQVFPGEAIAALVQGIAARAVLGTCDAVLSGYIGDAATGNAILHAATLVRAANPAALWCCDPVMGDDGPGLYVRPGILEFFRDRAVPATDILTPNQFELRLLTGQPCTTLHGTKQAVAALQARMAAPGPRIVLVTSLALDDTPKTAIDLLAASGSTFHRLRVPRLAFSGNGAGDALAAIFLFHWLRTRNAPQALAQAASAIHGLIAQTLQAGSRELLIVEAQQEFITPSIAFTAVSC